MSVRRTILASAVATTLLAARAGSAMTVVPIDLPALAGQAERIFVGRVEHVATGRDAHGLPATWTTFRIDERLKGPAGTSVTVKQLGATLGTGDHRVLPHPGLPRYQVGESVVLFVHPESALGFTSPVGLGQGCFRVRGAPDAPVVENEVGNRNLPAAGTPRTRTTIATAAPVPLDDFLARVRGLVDAGH